MNKKIIWIISGIVVLVATLLVLKKTGVIGKEEGTKVAIEKATLKDIIEVVTASGKVYPEIEVKISPDVSGEIMQLNVKEGDSVTKGQLLATVYADIYATQRDQAAAGVAQQNGTGRECNCIPCFFQGTHGSSRKTIPTSKTIVCRKSNFKTRI